MWMDVGEVIAEFDSRAFDFNGDGTSDARRLDSKTRRSENMGPRAPTLEAADLTVRTGEHRLAL